MYECSRLVIILLLIVKKFDYHLTFTYKDHVQTLRKKKSEDMKQLQRKRDYWFNGKLFGNASFNYSIKGCFIIVE